MRERQEAWRTCARLARAQVAQSRLSLPVLGWLDPRWPRAGLAYLCQVGQSPGGPELTLWRAAHAEQADDGLKAAVVDVPLGVDVPPAHGSDQATQHRVPLRFLGEKNKFVTIIQNKLAKIVQNNDIERTVSVLVTSTLLLMW